MENIAESAHADAKPRKKRGFGRWCVIFIRSLFILLFALILVGGLYFKAPWKILTLDALLLALLTVVPKKQRKYGWLALAVAVLAVTIWIFIPEKDSGNWRPYTFDAELAALEAARTVPPEDNAAPLYEELFERWKQIEENDPFPEEADDECVTQSRPWKADEFPEIAAWLNRHEEFFQDLIAATQKPTCYFPADASIFEFSDSMGRLSALREFTRHLIRESYLDLGENNDTVGGLDKQLAVLNLGKQIDQQPMLIDTLVGVAIEAMVYDALKKTLIQQPLPEGITSGNFLAMTDPIRSGYFDRQQRWQQILAYEKLFAKNYFGMFYEINPAGKIRFAKFKSFVNVIQDRCPNEELAELTNSYWVCVSWKISRFFLWFSGLPQDPKVLSESVNEVYRPLEKAVQKEDFSEIETQSCLSFGLNYKYVVNQMLQTGLPAISKVMGEILPKTQTQKQGTEIICDLVLYIKRHGQYPVTLDKLWSSEEQKQSCLEVYSGFIYEKTDDGFKLYHVGQNGIDEKGHYKMPKMDTNDFATDKYLEKKPEPDDILIWPVELENND